MAAEKFRASEEAYFKLRGRFDVGRITREQFDENLRQLSVQDTQGRYWMLGSESGKWYFYDGLNWVQGDPFAGAPAVFGPSRTPVDPNSEQARGTASAHKAPPPSTAASGDERGFPLLPLLIGATVIILLVAAFLVFRNRDRIFVAQQLPAQFTPTLPSTLVSVLPTATSEPDFFNTNTPVPTPSIGTLDIPTPEPTAPPVSVIPTITPFLLETPVPQPPGVTVPASTPFFPPPPTAPATGRLRVANGPDARARYMPALQFVLDGNFNEWSGDGVPLTVPHFGADNWLGAGDLSGTAWLGWNEDFLFLGVNVYDDAHVQTRRSWEMFRGDSVELWIDADLEGDFDVGEGNGDDYQFGFSPGDFAALIPEGVLYLPYRDAIVNQQILVAAQPNATGYTMEAQVPWAVLRIQPGQRRVFGYAVDLSDNDVPGTAQQQTQVNPNPNFRFQMPATFGNLILE